MAALPNIHLLSLFIVSETVVFRKKALYPIYLFVLITGLFSGFALWWIPYLYIWTVLWGAVMLIPEKIPEKRQVFLWILAAGLHGFFYGTLYAPAQAILFGMNFRGTVAWIVSGIPFDLIHGTSNLICGTLIYPLVKVLRKCMTWS